MRICYLTNSGDTLHTYRWIEAFVERGFDVHIISAEAGWSVPGAQMHLLPPPRRVPKTAMLQHVLALRRVVSQLRPEVLHGFPLTPFAALGAFIRVPLAITLWGSDLYKHEHRGRVPWPKRLALRRASCVTGDSLDLCRLAIRAGAKRERIRLVQLGVDLERFAPSTATAQTRARWGIAEGLVVLSPRSFHPLYNIETIVEAAALLESKLDVTFVFLAGSGDVAALRRLTSARLKHAVVLPELPHEQVADAYAVADVMVSVPDWDGTPVSLLEGMASGCLPVVSDTRSVREWITDEENGYVVPVEAGAIAQAIQAAFGRSDGAELVRRNRQIIETRANQRKEMDQMADYYADLAAGRPLRGHPPEV